MSQSSFTYSLGFRTDVGQQRSHNEDAAEVFDLPGAQAAFVVCDGMGGLRAGDVASREAVRVVEETLRTGFSADAGEAELTALLREAFTRANDAVNVLNRETDAALAASVAAEEQDAPTQRRAGGGGGSGGAAKGLMGTTCVTGVLVGDVLYLAHAGDSRAYRLRERALTRLTDDHSYVGERVRAGDISEAEAKVSRFRNIVTRAIGIEAAVDPEVRRERMMPGDTVVVCSDGLNTMLEDPEIAQILNAQARVTPERAASALVDAANKKGGHDNITVLVLRCAAAAGGAETPAPDGRKGGQSASGIVDMDAPPASGRRRVSRPSPVGAVLLGGLLFLALVAAALALAPSLRHRAIALLGGENSPGNAAAAPTGAASSPLVTDYARLVYDAPQSLAGYLARGDVLTFSRGEGLYFAYGGSGSVVSLGRDGHTKRDRGVAKLDLAPDDVKQESGGRVFITSDPQGNVYLSYTRRRVIEKKSPDGVLLQTLKGFDHPEAVALDEDTGDLYVVDANLIKVLRAHLPRAGVTTAATPSPSPAAKPVRKSAGG